MQACLNNVQVSTAPDNIRWAMEKSGEFTTKSFYKYMLNPVVSFTPMSEMWKIKIPLKVKLFMWLLNKDRIQAAE